MNNLKILLLISGLTVLFVMIGGYYGGTQGAMLFFVIALAMNFVGFWFSDKVAIKMAGAQPITPDEYPELFALVRELSEKADLPVPALYVTPSLQPNAFATGRDAKHAVVAVTAGLLRILNRDELAGVIAHELAHIKNKDMLLGTVVAAIAGAIGMIANIAQWSVFFGGKDEEDGNNSLIANLLFIIVAPMAAMLIQMAVSRAREYQADETGAKIAGKTGGLANALLILENSSQTIPMDIQPAAAHLFIVNPLNGESLMRLFSTHPPIAERVRRLMDMMV